MITEEQKNAFEELSRPAMNYLGNTFGPSAIIGAGIQLQVTIDFLARCPTTTSEQLEELVEYHKKLLDQKADNAAN